MVFLVTFCGCQCSSHISTFNQPQTIETDLATETGYLSSVHIGLQGKGFKAPLWSSSYPLTQVMADCSTDGFSSVQSLSRVQLFVTPWTTACQASLSITNSRNLPKLMSIESMMPSNHLILCCSLLLLPSIFPNISLFKWVSSSHQVAKVLEFQLQHQSFQWIFRIDFL